MSFSFLSTGGTSVPSAVLPAGDGLADWVRSTASVTITAQYQSIDMFPSSNNRVVTLPNPAAYPNARVDVYNQTNTTYVVRVVDHLGVLVRELQPTTAFSFYYDTPQGVAPWDTVQLDGTTVVTLNIAQYGDFNSINWNGLPSGEYAIAGTGSQFTNLPTGMVLLPASSYTFTVSHVNLAGDYYDTVFFTSNSDFTNNYLGRPCTRAGTDFGSATSVGWRIIGYKAEASYRLDAQTRSATPVAFPATDTVPYVWPTIVAEDGGLSGFYNATTGVFTTPFTGAYTFVFRFNAQANASTKVLCAGAEVFSGGSWVKSEFSAVIQAIRAGESTQVVFSSPVRFPANLQIRFPFWCDSGVTHQNIVTPNGTGWTVPAARLMILGVESQ